MKKNWNEFEKLDLSDAPHVSMKNVTPSGASSIRFLIQNGPRKEVGENGADLEVLGIVWRKILSQFQDRFPCKENEESIKHIGLAIDAQHERYKRRVMQELEGTDKPDK